MPIKNIRHKLNVKKNRIITISIISSLVVALAIIILGMSFYKYKIAEIGTPDNTVSNHYIYHYALISEEADAPFWDSVYQGAIAKGKEHDAYVEKMGSNLSMSYSLYDLMQIAIASKVDGIIIEPNGDENINELIDKAEKAGIPVVTVLNDAPLSKRTSFVGISSYSQGQAYGEQVEEVLRGGRNKVTVLLHEDNKVNKDNSQSIVYSSICEAVAKKNVQVESAVVNTMNTFSSEEAIRNIIMDTKNPPDVIVCLTAVDTLCAYQAIVDYNKVGQIEIIGYYDSDMILSAIDKEIIHSTMAINAEQMGAYCVQAMSEYRETKHVSNYFTVDINIISEKNVKKYIKVRENSTVQKK